MISLLFACRVVSDKQRPLAMGMTFVILRICGMDFWQSIIELNWIVSLLIYMCQHVYIEFQTNNNDNNDKLKKQVNRGDALQNLGDSIKR